MKKSILAAVALAASATFAQAAVTIDENGYGFVGKGDVQIVMDWNNAQLQEHADSLQFRFAGGESASWTCQGLNPSGNIVTNLHESTTAVNSAVAFDARKNKTGQITGFNLFGFSGGSTLTGDVPGTCPTDDPTKWVQPRQLLGEVAYDGTGEPSLQVSSDGTDWFDLTINY
jgi:hypothetical protein